ncbi:DMT family transporter [Sphingobium lignivorans]|uniref:S-adenosylmethionine uptake transporter n=1 Tax=Sphingobium lignivorans TaxID=2735886 RepID=A0ABR6NAU6_9SPHN|nr:DMT family transporter [Sphingobium lignivorans]MBB5984186.1 S-adenosylmethionine uptake transporter [Sphingobium lignivorans]
MPSTRANQALVPFAVACAAIAIFAGMDAVMKTLSIAIGAYNALLWRAIIGTIVLTPLYLLRVRRIPDRQTMLLHLGRSGAGAVSVLLFFWGLVRTPIAQGIALSFIAPLVALALAGLFLKEKISSRAVMGSLAAFVGVIVILAGQSGAKGQAGTLEGAVAILVGAVLYAVSLVIARRQSLAAGPIEVALAFNLIGAVLYGLAAPWLGQVPDMAHWPFLLLASAGGTSAIMLLAWSYARAEAQQLVVVEYTAFIWAVLLGWWIFGETVLPTTYAGALMIVAGCLWAARARQIAPRTLKPEILQ